jgi:hypothetical protein
VEDLKKLAPVDGQAQGAPDVRIPEEGMLVLLDDHREVPEVGLPTVRLESSVVCDG